MNLHKPWKIGVNENVHHWIPYRIRSPSTHSLPDRSAALSNRPAQRCCALSEHGHLTRFGWSWSHRCSPSLCPFHVHGQICAYSVLQEESCCTLVRSSKGISISNLTRLHSVHTLREHEEKWHIDECCRHCIELKYSMSKGANTWT